MVEAGIRHRILVVDDNALNRMLLRDFLSYKGYEVLEATNGEEGVQIAQEQNPSIVLMDIQMPVMDGFEATRILRHGLTASDVVIIAVTAMEATREEFISAGFDDYIAKPISIKQLSETVNSFIEQECIAA
jgi:two-component system cell cycle response regulator DivK